jgi:RimJ/RimL family protein N-acetyltransferase
MVTGGKVYLETERLLLRQFTETDIDNLFGLDSDPEVMRFVGGTPTARSAIEHDFLPACLRYYRQGNRYGFWAAIGKTTGDFLGWFHLRPRPDAGLNDPEIGYRLRRAAWGRGFATEGSRALVRKAFMELGVERVVASAFADNLASRRVMEKTGMRLLRT